ncbi:recombinase family protein [Novispirillum itersonii]|uniref:DNA invertase Pin-like site-specific DNA recombinase n=1 Tax=Novispirillum itersonii TaxID=189 RepID=A0A7X0DM99_NOVIT|nr:recombinase family protein [Novispirillum itersonii]MBB6210858.1 DNA invertase Pin-like site-specific DNA recombinase [Novispirillum itersonii]
MHTFAYLRVSTTGQTTDNQLVEIEQAGYEADTVYSDTISGKVPAMERPEFAKLMDTIHRTKKPKRLIVSKLDRLGRDAIDVLGSVRALEQAGCSVRVLQLGDLDLTSSAGKLVLSTLAAVAEMERDMLVERTQAGLARAKREGKKLGRPRVTDDDSVESIRNALGGGVSISQIARDHGISRATVIRVRGAAQ